MLARVVPKRRKRKVKGFLGAIVKCHSCREEEEHSHGDQFAVKLDLGDQRTGKWPEPSSSRHLGCPLIMKMTVPDGIYLFQTVWLQRGLARCSTGFLEMQRMKPVKRTSGKDVRLAGAGS